MANKEKYMIIVGFKGTEFNPLSFYSEGEPVKHDNNEIMKITNKEFKEHKIKVQEQENLSDMYSDPFSPQEGT